MSTWHQDKAGPLAAPETWTIEVNPPNETRVRVGGFANRAECEARIALWAANGSPDARHAYILAPVTLDCGHGLSPLRPGPGGAGYGTTRDGKKVCYACCAANDRADMIATGCATLYLVLRTVPRMPSDTDGVPLAERDAVYAKGTAARWFVINWPGSLEFKCFPGVKRNPRGGGFGSQRTDAWFNGPDGYVWHAVNRGNSDIARCKRTKEKVRS